MNKITSQLFVSAWMSTIEEKKQLLQTGWRNAIAFTSLIKGCEENIITLVADKLDLKCYPKDYYSIDSILYNDDDLVPDIPKNSIWFRQIKVAFEHENDFKSGLYKEVSHLLLVHSDLKVLVTYPNDDTSLEMASLHKIIKGTNQQKQLSETESFLIIFGYETNFEWEAFVYKEEDWKQIL